MFAYTVSSETLPMGNLNNNPGMTECIMLNACFLCTLVRVSVNSSEEKENLHTQKKNFWIISTAISSLRVLAFSTGRVL